MVANMSPHRNGADPGFSSPPRQTTVTSASQAMDPVVNNPALSTAIEVLGNISEIGKVLPLVAPAFILLKIIIDIEKRAQDVDAKCNDLIERITFMLSHLPILQKIEIMPATRQVVERMNEALKEAAALISAYRKQSAVARRLSLTNRDKFTTCAETVNTCCSDLLMSLQIHQSKQLEILTRAVPMDDDDRAAETFVNENGGSFEAVKYDRELVKEFAEQQHMDMDDSVMEQLEGNMSDTVQETQARLETIVRDNVGEAIVDGLKSLAAELNAAEAEQRFVCVQCEKPFTRYTNGPKACSYHRAEYDSWNKIYRCCDTAHPCQYSFHRERHHCDYPYETFFPRSRNITGYVDTVEEWAAVHDTDLEDESKVQKASVGKLLRWASRGTRLEETTLLISVGTVWFTEKYYFNTFTIPELENISKSVRLSRRTLIFRTSPSEEEYAMAEWLLSVSGKITGVRLTAKTATSSSPFVRVCPIDLAKGTKSGEVLAISDGGMRSYLPASPYVLPPMVRIGPEMSDEPLRTPRTDFKTRTTPSLRVILKNMGDPPLSANPNLASTQVDYFQGTVSVFNANAATSTNPITIAAARASYRFVGDKEYKSVEAFKLLESTEFPVTIGPRQSVNLKFEASVPRTEADIKQDVRWWNRAFCARHRPLRIKVVLEEIEGEECSIILEYIFKPFSFDKPTDADMGFFYFDDPDVIGRNVVRVQKSSSSDGVISIDGTDLTVKRLERIVYQALKTGKTDIDLGIGREKNYGTWEWNAWALVDISCRKVYAFKVLLQQGKLVEKKQFACLGYVLCPGYGETVQKARPISYATESVKLPALEPYSPPEQKTDDTFDDFKPPIPPKPSRSLSSNTFNGDSSLPNGAATGVLQVPPELNQRLASLDANLGRIAVALEQLVDTLQARR